jgi:hypothetical protein
LLSGVAFAGSKRPALLPELSDLGGQFVGAEQHFQPLHMASFIFYLALQANNRGAQSIVLSVKR